MSFSIISLYLLLNLLAPVAPPAKTTTSPEPITPKEFLIISTDGGQTWKELSRGIPSDTRVRSFWADDNTWYIGAEEGVFRGNALLPVPGWKKDMLQEISITNIVPGESGPYAVSHWRGFYQYQYASGQWNPMHASLKDKTVYTVLEATNGNLYAGCETGVFLSTDRGATWSHVHHPGTVHQLIESDGVVLALSNERLWRSTDGTSWTRAMSNSLAPFHIASTDNALYAITRGQELPGLRLANEVYRSTDNGATWSPVFEKLPGSLADIFELQKAGNAWIAASHSGLYRSTDNGIHWTQLVAPPAENRNVFYKLYVIDQQVFALRREGC